MSSLLEYLGHINMWWWFMINAMFYMLQLSSSCRMCNLCVMLINLLYHLENIMLLKVLFSKFDLEFQGSNIFSKRPLSASDSGVPASGIHFSIANASKNIHR
jgi:hypothetical protein